MRLSYIFQRQSFYFKIKFYQIVFLLIYDRLRQFLELIKKHGHVGIILEMPLGTIQHHEIFQTVIEI